MRVSKERAAENRERILGAASALIREHGILGAGVDAVAEAAGLTHGSVYSQFGSKDQLAAEALTHSFAKNAESLGRAEDFKSYVSQYLSKEHRDALAEGCAVAALGCEMSRSSEAVRNSFTAGVRAMLDRIIGFIRNGTRPRRNDEALATAATMVGALILSRAVNDPELADQILDASRKALTRSSPARR